MTRWLAAAYAGTVAAVVAVTVLPWDAVAGFLTGMAGHL